MPKARRKAKENYKIQKQKLLVIAKENYKKQKKTQNFDELRMKPEWSRFIDVYMANGGNAAEAYMEIYPDLKNKETAQSCSSRLLGHAIVREEIANRLAMERVTDGFIYSGLRDIAIQYRGAKTIMAAVKSYEILGKMRGLLIDTKRFQFTPGNPAICGPVVADDRKDILDAKVVGGGLIE
jgi:hypothetical protein